MPEVTSLVGVVGYLASLIAIGAFVITLLRYLRNLVKGKAPRPDCAVYAGIVVTAMLAVLGFGLLKVEPPPTPNPDRTPTIVTTATGTLDFYTALYAQARQGTPVLMSALGQQDSNAWDVKTDPDGGRCAFRDGAYHATIAVPDHLVQCLTTVRSFDNFALEVTMQIASGDEGGIVFRADPYNGIEFRLGIAPGSQQFDLLATTNPAQHLIPRGTTSLIHAGIGQSNSIVLIAHGAHAYLFINGQHVEIPGMHDISFPSGTPAFGALGVFAYDNTRPTDAAFTNVKVWPNPAS